MANMSYCRFENTYGDLLACYENMDDTEELTSYETSARKWVIALAVEIALQYGHEVGREVEEI